MSHSSLILGWHQPASNSTPLPVLHDGEGHLITIAPTGAGKGVCCIVPALLTYPGPVVVIDPKGENYAMTARRRREMGQQVHVLDPFHVTDAKERASLDPLDLVEVGSPDEADNAVVVTRLLMQGRTFKTDPFWDDRAETLIIGLIMHVLRGALPLRNLSEVRYNLSVNPANIRESDFLHQSAAVHPEIRAAQGIFLCGMADKTAASIVSTAAQHTGFLRSGPVADSITRSTIKLADIEAGKPMTVYLVVPPHKLGSHGKLLRLWLGVIMTALARRRSRPKQSTLLLVDEAAQLGPLDELRTAVTLMRGYGVKVWSFWQDMSQLRFTYPFDWQSMLNNSAVQLFFGASSPSALAALDEYLVFSSPKPLTQLQKNEALLVRTGEAPKVIIRANYLTDAKFAGQFDRNPFHGNARLEPRSRSPQEANVITFPGQDER